MRLLVLTSRYPWPPFRGDQLTVNRLVTFFSSRHIVDVVTFAPRRPEDRAATSELRASVRQWRDVPFSYSEAMVGVTGALLTGKPAQVGFFWSRRFMREVREVIASGEPDIVLSYYVRTAEYARRLKTSAARVVAHQLAMSLQYRRRADGLPYGLRRLVDRTEAALLKRYEQQTFGWADRCLLISPHDADAIGDVPKERVIANPHGVDLPESVPAIDEREPHTVLFTGRLAFAPNAEAIIAFVKDVWPLVLSSIPEARLRIVGARPGRAVRGLGAVRGVEVLADVPEMLPFQLRATVGVAPITAAAGLQNKVLEGMAAGLPMVVTSRANEGIGARPGSQVLVADTAQSQAAAVVSLLQDPDKRAALGAAARECIRAGWSWESHFARLETQLATLVS